ncbi:MAG: hypothetical protein ACM3X4_04030 [Ignavibacteriales bacterium]
MRRQISSKPDTCTESVDVDAAGISVKVDAQYPGRPASWPRAMVVERRRDRLAGVSRGRSKSIDRTEGPNMKHGMGDLNSDGDRRRRQYG